MRSLWNGSISFGLVNVPVKLYAATEANEVSLHQVHAADGGRIRYKRVCALDGQEVPYADVAKGYELPDGSMVQLSQDDLDSLPVASAKVIDVESFAPREQLAQMIPAKMYYVGPAGKGALRAYGLLAQALARTDRVAVARVAVRQRESLATLRVQDGVIVLETLLWPDEVRKPEVNYLDEVPAAKPAEVKMALSLIEAMTADFDPAAYQDQYSKALLELVESKSQGRTRPAKEAAARARAGTDLLDSLQASLDAKQPAPKRAPRKRAAAKAA